MDIRVSPRAPKEALQVKFIDKGETAIFRSESGKTLEIAIGNPEKVTRRTFINLARQIVWWAKGQKAKEIAVRLSDLKFPNLGGSEPEFLELFVTNAIMANLEFTKYKSSAEARPVKTLLLLGSQKKEIKDAIRRGKVIGNAVNRTREIANTPGSEMTPGLLAEVAREALMKTDVRIQVLGRSDIEALGMGGVLSVAKGSSEEPRFIVLEYMKGGEEDPVVLVGKGVTFDTGGINLKPTDGMKDMHLDMSGGAAVIGAMLAAANLKVKRNIVGLIPAVENMASGSSYRPGDIIRSMSGKTIEVLNTDAEGRIILADALTYAERYKPSLVIDVATLTGAAAVALGERASAIFTKDAVLEARFREAGEATGDFVWPLPLWDEYESEIRGTFGDWANIGKTRWGGAITAAIFLYQFAKKYPWAHIDIAPRMTAVEGEHLARGAAGAPVRLLVKLLETLPK